jgi:mRNA-degrading endonuclease toxin of MazEF toxin-antitoxin module
MPLPIPEPGLVIRYGYLWFDDHASGHASSPKDRPCAIILRTTFDDAEVIVTVLPITHTTPRSLDEAVELPPGVKQHLGLDSEKSWVLVSEVNRFVWPGPDLGAVPPAGSGRFDYGHLPPGLFRSIRERFLACAKAQRLRIVRRDT